MDVAIATPQPHAFEAAGARADARARRQDRVADAFAVLYGVVTTLVVHGYQYGRSNHTVYLLDPLRQARPELLTNDWFTTSTLQYHTIFGWISGWLMEIGQIERAFIAGYVALAVLLSVAWFRIVRRLGGSRLTFLLSVLLYYLSAAGAAMGGYQFMQDSSFLPSNIANVAMLWGIYLWMTRRYAWAGVALGVAGAFHLNHAVVAVGLWGALSVWALYTRESPAAPADGFADEAHPRQPVGILSRRGYWIGTAFVGVLCLVNIALALQALANRSGKMPLDEFIALYVKLRHPHHYDPATWPIALWVSFLWPLPFVAMLLPFVAMLLPFTLGTRAEYLPGRRAADTGPGDAAQRFAAVVHARREAAKIFLLLSALIIVALIAAGAMFVSESLVQLSLYRFSIYIKLFSMIAVAYLVCDAGLFSRRASRALIAMLIVVAIVAVILFVKTPAPFFWWHRGALALFTGLSVVPALYAFRPPRILLLIGALGLAAIPIVAWDRWLGMTTPQRIEPEYIRLCRWARDNTPIDAVFLVPPDDEAFRLHAQRAIVVNFKSVPQLSGELIEWRRRLRRVLGEHDLLTLPRPLHRTFEAIRERYESLPAEHLVSVAREYGARYVVVGHRLPQAYERQRVYPDSDAKGEYYVYDLAAGDAPGTSTREVSDGRT